MPSTRQTLVLIHALVPYLWPKKRGIRLKIMLTIFLSLATISLYVLLPLTLRAIINVISTPTTSLLLTEVIFFGYGTIWVLSKISGQLQHMSMSEPIAESTQTLYLALYNHLIHLPLSFYATRKMGEITTTIGRAQSGLRLLIKEVLFYTAPILIEIMLASIVLTYLYGVVYGSILITILTVFMAFSIVGSRFTQSSQRITHQKTSAINSYMADSIFNHETIHLFSMQHQAYKESSALLLEHEKAASKQHICYMVVAIGQALIMGIGLLILTRLSGYQVMQGTLNVSDFILINGYLLQFMIPLRMVGSVFCNITQSITDLECAIDFFKDTSNVIDHHVYPALSIEKGGQIMFDHVNFSYDNERKILKNICFEIPARKTIALVGPTGAGKSTIAKLLFRFYDDWTGTILIDGQNIREVDPLSLRKMIGIVPQHTALFHNTLRYNIAFGSSEASEEAIQKAVEQAHLKAFVETLPDGLNTMVGEHGLKLSGGERQRVAIARVLLKNPAIYIFDEATSSLDMETERLIQKNIDVLSKQATTLIIAHRLSTVAHADHILFMEHGVIKEQGTHEDLLNHCGRYAHLWSHHACHSL